jgi:hypothetical protein
MASAREISKRFKKAQDRKVNWAELYEDALEYSAPNRNTFDEEFPGQHKDGKGRVYDSTALNSMQKFASNIQSSLTPSMRQWIKLKPGPNLQADQNIADQLSSITDVMFSHISNSNFDTQIAESYLDLAVGTGALLIQKGKTAQKPLEFTNVPLSQLFLEEGPHGRIETAFRKHKVALRNIQSMWEDAELNAVLTERLERKPDDQINLIEATVPDEVEIFNPRSNQREKVQGYRYYVIAENQEHILVEREQRSSPWVIFRWSSLPGEIYGRGPLLQALPDIKTINKTKELLLKAGSIGIYGMYTAADDGVINLENIKFSPGAVIPVESNSGGVRGRTLEPLQTSSRVDLSQIIINDLRQAINEMMFAEPLGPVDAPVKTATEVSLRQQELSRRIGSAFGKLQFELITPMINRVLDLLDEQGLIDLGPFRVDGNVIAIQHISPLALAQNEEEFSNMLRYAETLANLFGPQMAMALLKPDVFSKVVAEKLNVPQEIVPSDKEFAMIKQALQQSAAQGQVDPAQVVGG